MFIQLNSKYNCKVLFYDLGSCSLQHIPEYGPCWVNANLDADGNYNLDGTECPLKGNCGEEGSYIKFAYKSKEDCMICGWESFDKMIQKDGTYLLFFRIIHIF